MGVDYVEAKDTEFGEKVIACAARLLITAGTYGLDDQVGLMNIVSYSLAASIESPEWAVAALQMLGVDGEHRRAAAEWFFKNAPIYGDDNA